MKKIRSSTSINEELVEEIYHAATDSEHWHSVMQVVKNSVHADSCNIYFVDMEHHGLGMMSSTHYTQDEISHYGENFAHKDLWNIEANKRSSGQLYLTQNLVRIPVYLDSEVYCEFFKHHNMLHGLGGAFMNFGPWTGYLGLLREHGQMPFTFESKNVLQPLMKHLNRAFIISNQLARQQDIYVASTSVLNKLEMGILLIDQYGLCIHINQQADRILSKGGLRVHQKRLFSENQTQSQTLQRLLKDVTCRSLLSPEPGGGVIQLRRKQGADLQLLITPYRNRLQENQFNSFIHAIVFLSDPDEQPTPEMGVVSQLYQLTIKETKVLKLLLANFTTSEISESLNVSLDAVRFHLKNLFDKTGTRRQSELVMLVLNGLGMF